MKTIKEEKKADLGQLLNMLIQRGWKPRGKTGIDERDGFVYMNKGQCIRLHKGIQANNMLCGEYNLRELVSKESGLWQFVCENGMVKHEVYEDIQSWEHTTAEHSDFWYTSGDNYEYRLIESALKDESELEDFLLQNIKVDAND